MPLGETVSDGGKEATLLERRNAISSVLEFYHGIRQKETEEARLRRPGAFLRLIWGNARTLLGRNPNDTDESLRARMDSALGAIPLSLEEEIKARKRAGEKTKFITKRKLLKLVAEKFQQAFTGQCNESDRVLEGDPSLSFEMKCSDWILTTHFWFGRGATLLDYSHNIASENAVEFKGSDNFTCMSAS